MNTVKAITKLITELSSTTSENDKIAILWDYRGMEEILSEIYDSNRKFNVTSNTCKKKSHLVAPWSNSLQDLLLLLTERRATGDLAISVCNGFAKNLSDVDKETFWKIIDKDLRCRINMKTIEKAYSTVIKAFNVALANKYDSKKHDILDGSWICSQKRDGLRFIAIVDPNNEVLFFSRSGKGKEFNTAFAPLIPLIQNLSIQGHVLDGEICEIHDDGSENFQKIQSMASTKGKIATNVAYEIFDCIKDEHFWNCNSKSPNLKNRLEFLKGKITSSTCVINMEFNQRIRMLEQVPINNQETFQKMLDKARLNNWEGLILRKDNTTYDGKRSDDLLKVKDFQDAEYDVESIELGPIRYVKNRKEVEENKGNGVSVGSGFTIQQRIEFFTDPTKNIGKVVTVKYFEESKNKEGGVSLRFPTIDKIH